MRVLHGQPEKPILEGNIGGDCDVCSDEEPVARLNAEGRRDECVGLNHKWLSWPRLPSPLGISGAITREIVYLGTRPDFTARLYHLEHSSLATFVPHREGQAYSSVTSSGPACRFQCMAGIE